MEKIKTLGEFIAHLAELDPDETIYALEPWTEESPAIVVVPPEDGICQKRQSEPAWNIFLKYSLHWRLSRIGFRLKTSPQHLVRYATG